ncbi:MAG: hypothetical protein QM784_20640 [Polyangiaceae bacterium]
MQYGRPHWTEKASRRATLAALTSMSMCLACNGRTFSLGSGPILRTDGESDTETESGGTLAVAPATHRTETGGTNASVTAAGGTSTAGTGGTAIGGSSASVTAIGGTSTAGTGGTAIGGSSASVTALGGTGGTGGTTFTQSEVDCQATDFRSTSRLVSASSDGSVANRDSFQPSLSADGRILAFSSLADNLVEGDTNGVADVFTYDRDTLELTRMSVDTSGAEFRAESTTPAISPDAQRIAIATSASNLDGTSSASIVALTPPALDVNRWLPGVTAVTPLSTVGSSLHPMLSNGGTLLVFHSQASNLVSDDTNGRDDFFAFRPSTGVLERLITANDAPGFVIDACRPRLSADGSVLAFCAHQGTAPSNVSILHLDTKRSEWAGLSTAGEISNGVCHSPALSAAGDVVAMICDGNDLVPGDTNGLPDVFVRDLVNHTTTRVSLFDDGSESPLESVSVGISGNGRWVVMQWGYVAGPTPERTFGGVAFYDRKCGVAKTLFIASDTAAGTIGSESRIEDIAMSHDGRTLVGTVTNVRSSSSTSYVTLTRFPSLD